MDAPETDAVASHPRRRPESPLGGRPNAVRRERGGTASHSKDFPVLVAPCPCETLRAEPYALRAGFAQPAKNDDLSL